MNSEQKTLTAVSFSDVSKIYQYHSGIYRVRSFLDRLRNAQLSGKTLNERPLHALKNISFRIQKNERVALIGENGSGKSTLLKLISGVSRLTAGEVFINGRVGGLIEVEAGFHPDLTGKENILLNGAFNDLSQNESESLIPEILNIADLHDFADLPLRKYSSGMRMRLGFATAMIHKPDIVLLDEVFSVGDEDFRSKSRELMSDYLQDSTLLFVSHSAEDVLANCDRALVLSEGELVFDGETKEALEFYREGKRVGTESEGLAYLSRRKVVRGSSRVPLLTLSSITRNPVHGLEEHFSLKLSNESGSDIEADLIFEIYRSSVGKIKHLIFGQKLDAQKVVDGESSIEVRFNVEALLAGRYFIKVSAQQSKLPADYAFSIVSMFFEVDNQNSKQSYGTVDLSLSLRTD